jgi:putative oxidoreductase
MWKKLLATSNDPAFTVLRVLLAIVFFPHGAQKLFGWFGGGGASGTIAFFQQTWGIPVYLTVLVILVESVGAVSLVAGFMTRVWAAGLAIDMVVAVYLNHLGNGFFMNWSGRQGGEGFEFHILAFAIAVALVIGGGGAWSVDRAVVGRGASPASRVGPVPL